MSKPASAAVLLFPAPESVPELASTANPVSMWQAIPALQADTPRPFTKSPGSRRKSDAHAAEVVEAAQKEAASIRAAARKEAQALVAEAKASAGIVRQEAFVDGYASGLVGAREEVERELGEKFDARCAALKASVDAVITAIADEREAMWRHMEGEVTGLALDIARKIIKVEIAQNETVIDAVVTDALRRVNDRTTLRILINPEELQHVRAGREDLLMAIDGVKNLEIDGDRRIGRGGCVIETNAGSIDAKVDTQIEQVESALRA